MQLSEEHFNRVLRNASGSYITTDWAITDAEGNPAQAMKPGGFVVVENYYSYLVLHINDDMSLTECERGD
jgi:hypothetical protein